CASQIQWWTWVASSASSVGVPTGGCSSSPGAGSGPFVRGDGLNIGQRGGWRQAGGAKNFDRYRCVTLWRQEKTPRPARMQIRGCWVTSTQQRRYGGGSRQTAPHS